MTAALLFLLILLSLTASAFCSGAETGFLTVSRGRLLHLVREGSRRAKALYEAASDMGRTTTAILVGNNLVGVVYSSATAAFIAAVGVRTPLAETFCSLISALVILLFGEFLPKLFFSARPLRRLLMLTPAWCVFVRLFAPIGMLVATLIEWLMPKREQRQKLTPEAVLKILEDRQDGVKLSDLESALIGRIMVLRAKGEFIIPETLLSALDQTNLKDDYENTERSTRGH